MIERISRARRRAPVSRRAYPRRLVGAGFLRRSRPGPSSRTGSFVSA